MKKYVLTIMVVILTFLLVVTSPVLAATKKTTTVSTTKTTTTQSTTKKTTARLCPSDIVRKLKEEASNITASYEFVRTADMVPKGFLITINNIPKSMFINVSNDKNEKKLFIYYTDTGNKDVTYNCDSKPIDSTEAEKLKNLKNDGIFVFRECAMNSVTKYTFAVSVSRTAVQEMLRSEKYEDYYKKVYNAYYNDFYNKQLASLKDAEKAKEAALKQVEAGVSDEINLVSKACVKDNLRNIKLTTPKKNDWYDEIALCKDEELKDSYYCQEWISSDFKVSKDSAIASLEEAKKKKSNVKATKCYKCIAMEERLNDFFVKYGVIVILIISLLVVADIAFIVYNLWRRKEKGKL